MANWTSGIMLFCLLLSADQVFFRTCSPWESVPVFSIRKSTYASIKIESESPILNYTSAMLDIAARITDNKWHLHMLDITARITDNKWHLHMLDITARITDNKWHLHMLDITARITDNKWHLHHVRYCSQNHR